MVGKNKKRLEITLTNEEHALLESLSSRFNISKSQVVKQAIKVFASKRKHVYTTIIAETKTKNENNEAENISWDDLMKELN